MLRQEISTPKGQTYMTGVFGSQNQQSWFKRSCNGSVRISKCCISLRFCAERGHTTVRALLTAACPVTYSRSSPFHNRHLSTFWTTVYLRLCSPKYFVSFLLLEGSGADIPKYKTFTKEQGCVGAGYYFRRRDYRFLPRKEASLTSVSTSEPALRTASAIAIELMAEMAWVAGFRRLVNSKPS